MCRREKSTLPFQKEKSKISRHLADMASSKPRYLLDIPADLYQTSRRYLDLWLISAGEKPKYGYLCQVSDT